MSQPTHPTTPPAELSDAALAAFTDYFVRNYPGPDTIIGNPHWHAPRIFRAAKRAIEAARELPTASLGEGLIRFDWETGDPNRPWDSKVITHDEMRQRYADMHRQAKTAPFAPTPSTAGSGDAVEAALEYAHNDPSLTVENFNAQFTPPAKPEAGEVVLELLAAVQAVLAAPGTWTSGYVDSIGRLREAYATAIAPKKCRVCGHDQTCVDSAGAEHCDECGATTAERLTAKAEGDGGEWRLLTRADRIESGDQILGDDTVSWVSPNGWAIGMEYDPGLHVPARRATTQARP